MRSAAWKGNDWNLIFVSDVGTPLEPRNVTRHYKVMLMKAGLPSFRFHDLRGAFATALAVENLPVSVTQKSLGHSNSSQTLDVYTNIPQTALNIVAETMDHLYPYPPDLTASEGTTATIGG